jgi:hypothetical protein
LAFSPDGFDKAVSLPLGRTIAHLRNAIEFVEEKAEELIELYFEQLAGSLGFLEFAPLTLSVPTNATNILMSPNSDSLTYP